MSQHCTSAPWATARETSLARGLAIASSAVVLLGTLALRLATTAQASWSAVAAPGPARGDDAMALLTSAAALGITIWLLGALLLSISAALAGSRTPTGRLVTRAAGRVTPTVLRHAVAGLLGVVIAATPVAANAAAGVAGSLPRNAGLSTGQSAVGVGDLSPAFTSSGPVSLSGAVRAGHPGPVKTTTERTDLLPGWFPTQPQAAKGEKALATSAPTTATDATSGKPGDAASGAADDDKPGTTAPRTTAGAPTASAPTTRGTTARTTPSTTAGTTGVATPGNTGGTTPGTTGGTSQGGEGSAATSEATPKSTAQEGRSPRRPYANGEHEIVVHRGDSLWAIAARHLGPGASDAEIALEWPHWFTANRAVIGADPDHLSPGQRLRPPHKPDTTAGGNAR